MRERDESPQQPPGGLDRVLEVAGEGERFLSTLLSNLPGMVYRCQNDPAWTMVFCSEGTRELTGYAPGDLVAGRRLDYGDLIVEDDRDPVWRGIQDALARRDPFRLTYRIRTAGGAVKWVWEQGRGIWDDEGRLLFLEGFITDVTDRVLAEEALRRSEDELHQARQMEALGRLAGGIAHDFNNLLRAITGHTEALLHALPADSPLRARVGAILQAADRGAALSSRLLSGGRRLQGAHLPLALHRLLRDSLGLLEALSGPEVRVELELAPGEVELQGDPLQLEQVLMNLALNAREAMPEGGRLTLRTELLELQEPEAGLPAGSYVRVQVQDTGHGMEEEVRLRVFDPFFTTRETGKGTGLGLFSAYGIVQQHQGRLSVESQPGKGTTFTLLLPVVGHQEPAPEPPGPVRGGTETLLLAEDEDLLRELAAESLRQAGYRVLQASDGEQALRLALEHPGPLDLVITDVVMPRMDGFELARRLRGARPGLRVLYVTGYMHRARTEDEEPVEGAVIDKPFRAETLLRRVRAVLDEVPA